MTWQKRGLLFTPDPFVGQISHAQMPRAVVLKDRVRVFFSSRDEQNRSLPYFADFDEDLNLLDYSTRPIAPLGKSGAFDQHGVMPCSVSWNNQSQLELIYVGWQRTRDTPYRTAIGSMIWEDGWKKTNRIYHTDVYGATTLFQDAVDMIDYHTVFEAWEDKEPVYRIPAIDHLTEGQCACSPVLIRDGDGVRHLFYSVRSVHNYREDRRKSYRIAKCTYIGGQWIPTDPGIDVSENEADFDYDMICYADVLYLKDRYVMLYNGNEFGRYGFGWAETDTL